MKLSPAMKFLVTVGFDERDGNEYSLKVWKASQEPRFECIREVRFQSKQKFIKYELIGYMEQECLVVATDKSLTLIKLSDQELVET